MKCRWWQQNCPLNVSRVPEYIRECLAIEIILRCRDFYKPPSSLDASTELINISGSILESQNQKKTELSIAVFPKVHLFQNHQGASWKSKFLGLPSPPKSVAWNLHWTNTLVCYIDKGGRAICGGQSMGMRDGLKPSVCHSVDVRLREQLLYLDSGLHKPFLELLFGTHTEPWMTFRLSTRPPFSAYIML